MNLKTFKTVAIVLAVIILVIVILLVFKDNWINLVDSFLDWIQGLMGIPEAQRWSFGGGVTSSAPW